MDGFGNDPLFERFANEEDKGFLRNTSLSTIFPGITTWFLVLARTAFSERFHEQYIEMRALHLGLV